MYPHTLRAYYTSAGKSNQIGGGLELWRGFFQYGQIFRLFFL
jgi:Argonaute linker 1 domain